MVQWAGEAHGFPTSTTQTAPTIELAFTSIPRKLGSRGAHLDELDVLFGDRHTALLGDPGAGKTTTLRRLANVVALADQQRSGDQFRFVVLLVCREEDWSDSTLLQHLRDKVGITPKIASELDDPDARLRAVLDSGALVVVDGLDEVAAAARDGIERALVSLGRHLTNAKIIVSCRTGDYTPLEQFDTAEILPLTVEQIRRASIALLGPSDGALFVEQLESSSDNPSLALVDRPLFLGFTAMIFKARGTVPDRPVELYDAITRLVIQDWDEHRSVQRPSRYAGFTVDDKRRFLSDLALELLLKQRQQFTHAELLTAYGEIHERYDLPASQAVRVARELESHTGLIQEVGQHFEFSHLSLQEYLAADSFNRAGARTRELWTEVPAVAAVAVALASSANDWFNDLVDLLPKEIQDNRPIHTFLSRLALEQPRFVESHALGDRLLRLLWRAHIDDWQGSRTLAGTAMAKSVKAAINDFDTYSWQGDQIIMSKLDTSRRPAEGVAVNVGILRTLLGEQAMHDMQRRLA